MMRRLIVAAALVPAAVIATGTAQAAPQSAARYVIRFKDTTAAYDVERNVKKNWDATATSGKREFKQLSRVFNGAVATLTKPELNDLKKVSSVLWAEEDLPVTTSATVTPPSWGLDRLDQRALPLDLQYSYPNAGAGVDVYVVDTGVMATHAQFAGRIGTLPDDAFTAVDDGEGAGDCNGHGTHVAGIAAGDSVGVAPLARVIPVRVLDCAGSGTVSGVVSGIEWVIAHHTNRPSVVNLSFTTVESVALESAVDRAYADGLTVVVAAGNSNVDACSMSPAGAKVSALTVGATAQTDVRASYSNYGECVDLFAPGSLIVSAGVSSPVATTTMSGTSMAAPHVAGLAARFLSSNPTAAPQTVMDAIINDSTPNVVSGAGTLSPNRLAFASGGVVPVATTTVPTATTTTGGPQAAPAVPGVVSGLTVVAGASSADLSWNEGAIGSLPTTSHIVRVYADGVLVDTVVVDNDSTHVIPGLLPSVTYTFRVASANGNGVGEFSPASPAVVPLRQTAAYTAPGTSTTVTDSVAPKAPKKVRAYRSGRQVVIKWTPTVGARVTGFEIKLYRNGKVAARVVTAATGGVRLSGIARGRSLVRVRALNTAGASPYSKAVTIAY